MSMCHFPLQNLSSLPPPALRVLPWFSLAMGALSSQAAKVLSRQVFSSGTRQLPLLVALQVSDDTYYDLKHPRSVKENSSQWESELLCVSHVAELQWPCGVRVTPLNRGRHSPTCGSFKDRPHSTLPASKCPEEFMPLLPTYTQASATGILNINSAGSQSSGVPSCVQPGLVTSAQHRAHPGCSIHLGIHESKAIVPALKESLYCHQPPT